MISLLNILISGCRIPVVASSATRRGGGYGLINYMWYLYILESKKNGRNYIGSTQDLKRRMLEHNSRRGGVYTSKQGGWLLIFYEAFVDKKDALKAEKFFKSGYGREVLKDKLENYYKDRGVVYR